MVKGFVFVDNQHWHKSDFAEKVNNPSLHALWPVDVGGGGAISLPVGVTEPDPQAICQRQLCLHSQTTIADCIFIYTQL